MGGNTTLTKVKGTGSLLGAAFVVGTFGIFSRFVSPMFGFAAQTAVRFGLATVLVGGLTLLYRQKSYRIARQHMTPLLLLGLGSFGLGMLFTIAVNRTKVADGLSLLFAGSIITALIVGTTIFKEKVTPSKVAAIGVALVGLAMYAHSFAELNIGALAGVAAGVLDGSCNSLRKRLKAVDRHLVVMYQYFIGALCALPFVLFGGGQAIKAVSAGAIAAMVFYAVFSVALGNLLMYGFARFDVNVGSIVMASQIFFAMILGMIFLHEFPTGYELTGAVLIFSATTFTALDIGRVWDWLQRSRLEEVAE